MNDSVRTFVKITLMIFLCGLLGACEEILQDDSSERIAQIELIQYSEQINIGECSDPFIVQRQTQDGFPASSGTTTVTLRDDSSATIFSDSDCTMPIRGPSQIGEGEDSLTFYIQMDQSESFLIQITSPGFEAIYFEINE